MGGKIWIIIAVLFVIGGILFLIGCTKIGFDFTKLNTADTVTNTYSFDDEIKNISVNCDTANVFFEPSDDGKCTVICEEPEKRTHKVEVVDGELRITLPENNVPKVSIGFGISIQQIKVKLPAGEYEKITVDTDTGRIDMPDAFSFAEAKCETDTGSIRWQAGVNGAMVTECDTGKTEFIGASFGNLNVESDTGSVVLSDVTVSGTIEAETDTGRVRLSGCRSTDMKLSSDTGAVELKNTFASGKMNISTGTGGVHIDACDAAEIRIRASTGSVYGTFTSPKIFYAASGTGRVSVPKSVSGGICDVETGTGSITMSIVEK